jgi:hypothetical protein
VFPWLGWQRGSARAQRGGSRRGRSALFARKGTLMTREGRSLGRRRRPPRARRASAAPAGEIARPARRDRLRRSMRPSSYARGVRSVPEGGPSIAPRSPFEGTERTRRARAGGSPRPPRTLPSRPRAMLLACRSCPPPPARGRSSPLCRARVPRPGGPPTRRDDGPHSRRSIPDRESSIVDAVEGLLLGRRVACPSSTWRCRPDSMRVSSCRAHDSDRAGVSTARLAVSRPRLS